jgi:hypothetical protein
MALTLKPPKLTVYFVDDDGAKSSTSIHMPTSFDAVAVVNAALEIIPLMVAISCAGFVEASVSFGIYDPDATGAQSGSDVEKKAYFSFNTADFTRAKMAFPALYEDMYEANNLYVDEADPDISAFLTALLDGVSVNDGAGSPTTVSFCEYREADLTGLEKAYAQHRRSLKRTGAGRIG